MNTAKLIPNVSECASELRPAVLAIPINPRTTTGQHQLPIRAGTDSSNIHIDVIILFLDGNVPVSPETGLGSPRRGGIAHAILSLRERINIDISKTYFMAHYILRCSYTVPLKAITTIAITRLSNAPPTASPSIANSETATRSTGSTGL